MNTSNYNTGLSSNSALRNQSITKVDLPVQRVEKPVAIHEEIRREQVEEIQPIINVEKFKTEVIQKTQPLLDKEVRPVFVEQRTLASQTLPEVIVPTIQAPIAREVNTVRELNTESIVVEKPAIINEVEKRQVIEEIQPVIYKETVVPTLIRETKPVYQKVVEGTTYQSELLAPRTINVSQDNTQLNREAALNAPILQSSNVHLDLPVQIVEKPAAIHEEIRREQVEEIQPIINVEKFKTEVIQKTQPLMDKEVRPVFVEQRTLASQTLPEVVMQSNQVPIAREVNTVRELNTQSIVVEKPAIYNEIDKLQIVEEIQPVIYKETVVPTLIRETKPVYQKVVEGTTYQSELLAPRTINVSQDNTQLNREAALNAPVLQSSNVHLDLPVQIIEKPAAIHEEIRREQVEEIQPIINVEKFKIEIIQKKQPLLDKEVRPVFVEQRTLASQILPEVVMRTVQAPMTREVSTVRELNTESVIVEKAAIINEVEKRQVIEEIQPIIYKETIVPTLIRETKPVYQKVVEATTYVHQTLPPMAFNQSRYYSANSNDGLNNSALNSGLNNGSNNSGWNNNGLDNSGFNSGLNSGLNSDLNSGFNSNGLNNSGFNSGLNNSALNNGLNNSGLNNGLNNSGWNNNGLNNNGLNNNGLNNSGFNGGLNNNGLNNSGWNNSGFNNSALNSGLNNSGLNNGSGWNNNGLNNSGWNNNSGLNNSLNNNGLNNRAAINQPGLVEEKVNTKTTNAPYQPVQNL
jgi:hypothetical protein